MKSVFGAEFLNQLLWQNTCAVGYFLIKQTCAWLFNRAAVVFSF